MLSRKGLAPVTLAVLAAMSTASASAEDQPAPRTPAAPSMTVMTYNVNYGKTGRGETMAAIAEGDADVVLLQETTASWEKVLRKRFKDRYAHIVFHHHSRAAGGLAVLSRFPITDDKLLPPTEGWFPAQQLTIDSPLGAVDVLNLHLRPAIKDGSWIKGYLETPPIREREITEYWKQLPRTPAIVAGDFNEEPDKVVGKFLADKGLTRVDTGGKPTSWSWSGTYQGHAVDLAMDIDHVVIGGGLKATAATVLDKGKSDHRPVLVTLTAATPAPTQP
jgi:endonuclease/exonuclease/phosphatase (EEP) superfamily protein YafD